MGNALTYPSNDQLKSAVEFLYSKYIDPGTTATDNDSGSLGPHRESADAVSVSALAHDLFRFENTSQVPEGLKKHFVSSKKAQLSNWYTELLIAWREAKPQPETPEDTARLVIQTFKNHQKADVEVLLAFYGLPLPHTLVQATAEVPKSLPEGVIFEMHTLPVDAKSIPDGDGFSVYVRTDDPRESSCVPADVQMAAVQRSEARDEKNYGVADAILKTIKEAGYGLIHLQNNEEILARKYRIRLRGVDAPESSMAYGKEAKEELTKLIKGKCLRIFVYGQDQFGRCIGDVYCNDMFVQELMLKKGCVWHYTAFDQRPELAMWENEARAKKVGLWASSNPEKPWEWRKERRG